MQLTRIIIPVFGKVLVQPLVGKIAFLPEIQRLRHVSLSNIDSCSLTAIGGVSRFEHSLGTAMLASKLSERLSLDKEFQSELILAAGLHDVTAPGLGHLFEEGCEMVGEQFDHEMWLRRIFLEEGDEYFQAYLGMELGCRKLMAELHVSQQAVFDAIVGKGRCSAAIKGSMDLDNIDNVARMLSRLEISVDSKKIINLMNFFSVSNGRIVVRKDRTDLFQEWLVLRRELYDILMLEPMDFSAKTMMKIAITTGLVEGALSVVEDWHLTDSELIHKLLDHASTKEIVRRLLLGKYYRNIAMYWIEGHKSIKTLQDNTQRENFQNQIRRLLGDGIFVDYIPDKRDRAIDGLSTPKRALLSVVSSHSSPSKISVKRERELCNEFVRAHLTVSERVFPDGRCLAANGLSLQEQAQLPFDDI